ncbi:MAG TPA: S8 family serine peptidase [Patescibacteria group bacterium]|nr:S8 family serine peptidase [Patescibacteria group bacterium]
MRQILAAAAAFALALSTVGGAAGAEPGTSLPPAPIVDPAPSVEPGPSFEPGPSGTPAADPTATPETAPGDRPGIPASPSPPVADPAASATALIVAAPVAPASSAKGSPRRAATDPAGRWIVVLKAGTDSVATADRQGKRIGFVRDRTYKHAFRGYSASLDRAQVTTLSHDPSVSMIVADEKIVAEAQTMPTGVSRMGARRSTVARIDGVDQRVDADVAIVDTGIARVADLNVAGGYNCSTPDPTLWRDTYGHGTHVAGTVGALDNGSGVVGVAPGVRLWAVKILDDTGEGLLSWYVCGLDWIASQRDPGDPSRPRFEAVNMSVAKYGKDDANCGQTNSDILHQGICRLVASGVTVVAAAGNDSSSAAARVPAAYNEVITVSALADSDGLAGGLGGNRCYSWGTYDSDDTFADFSNYGSDVDLIAPGKCIWSTVPSGYRYSSGTSMAAPHVAGAAALLMASRPGLTPAEVREALLYLGNLDWTTSSDPDARHEKMLDASRIGPRGTFSVSAGPRAVVGESGGVAHVTISIGRSATSFERIRLSATNLPAGTSASFSAASVYGFGTGTSTLTVNVPSGVAPGTYLVTVVADEHGTSRSTDATIVVDGDRPVARIPTAAPLVRSVVGSTSVVSRVTWPAATDASSDIVGYELEASVDGDAWTATASTPATTRAANVTQTTGHSYRFRVRARDSVGSWSDWATGATDTSSLVSDRSTAVSYSGTWKKALYSLATNGCTTYATAAGARARLTFSGRAVALIAPVGPTRGSATIYVDGVSRGSVGFHGTSGKSRLIMFSTAFASLGSHTIEVRVAGNGRVDVDGFVIFR